ncbi:MAG: DegT/DnrJ/EryC1/StrS family aminotransferase, partial [Spirochaetota bacterium]
MQKLAINGGKKAISKDLELPDWPIITDDDVKAINRVIDSGSLWGKENSEVIAWEREYAEYVGAKYCLALNSGTASLHASIAGTGIEPGDEIIVPSLTFLASATAVLHHNAIPVFVDIDPKTFNIDPAKIEPKITDRTKAIMAVDYHGLPADYDAIYEVARKHNLVVIEDGSQAGGALYKGKKVGNIGDICGASTMPLKPIPGGSEGGVLTTNNETYRDLADMVRMFGEIISTGEERQYNAYTMGWNYRITPFSAAMARSQLKRTDQYLNARREKAAYISKNLAELPGIIPPYIPEGSTHSYYIYYFKLDPESAGLDVSPGRFRQAVQEILRAEGVYVKLSQRTPIPGQALFQIKRGFGRGVPWKSNYGRDIDYRIEDYPVTMDIIDRALALDVRYMNPLSDRSIQDKVLEAFRKVWEHLDEVASYAKKLDYVP